MCTRGSAEWVKWVWARKTMEQRPSVFMLVDESDLDDNGD